MEPSGRSLGTPPRRRSADFRRRFINRRSWSRHFPSPSNVPSRKCSTRCCRAM